MMKKVKGGMTLIELIVSIALLGILVVSFLGIFMAGFSGIAGAGNRSMAQYSVQAQIEEDLSSGTYGVGSDKLSIYFSDDAGDKIEVTGSIKTENTVVNGKEVNITFFKPDK